MSEFRILNISFRQENGADSPPQRNIALTLSYDGSHFSGWQVQPDKQTVQGRVEQAIQTITQCRSNLSATGRTDSGVHALGQVCNFRTSTTIKLSNLRAGLQSQLGRSIVIQNIHEVEYDFHATYCAVEKTYRYLIHAGGVSVPFLDNCVYWIRNPLNVDNMHAAAQFLVGRHDFRSFETNYPNKASSVRTVKTVSVHQIDGWPMWAYSPTLNTTAPGKFLALEITADGFLYNMVRAIVGTLIKIGQGDWPMERMRDIIEAQNRSEAGPTAPPQGLYLVNAKYDPPLWDRLALLGDANQDDSRRGSAP